MEWYFLMLLVSLMLGCLAGYFLPREWRSYMTLSAVAYAGYSYYSTVVHSATGNALADGLGFILTVLLPILLLNGALWVTVALLHLKQKSAP
jgi:hypothetical protein